MYNLTIKNDYIYDLGTSTGVTISKGKSFTLNDRGSLVLTIPGMSNMNFIDLGDKKLEGFPFPKETWGTLVRYSTIEAYYRYEGQGELTVVVDSLGMCTISTTNGSMIRISIPEFVIQQH
ncbi:hypothetical protein SAMN05421847_0880 [Halpernia humi]|uniref:Uncharacterized protein n=1 Tax=Halpernia humi TaxID=493375 RepID=A0A1H5UQU8_9FLAO|nr:hypothetical protein [Halpernia humi]SEF77390.1 hypothetical protein SAMN05421847_0880 [Halpernia humi]